MDLEKQAIDILQGFAGKEPYQLGYSGGKDSDVILHLAKKAGVSFVAVHNLTTVDAPETVRYIRSKPEVIIEYPPMTMWQLIVKHKTPPTRLFRYCCEELKERSGKGKKLITGVRKAESLRRAENQGVITFAKPNKEIRNSVDDEIFSFNNSGGVIVLNYDNAESHRMVWQNNYYQFSWVCVKTDVFSIGAKWDLWSIKSFEIEVIGNVFDNPELLEV